MPHYYFDLRDGDAYSKDEEGVELLDIAEAQIEAAESLADMAKELTMRSVEPSGQRMAVEVRDQHGLLFSLGFAFARNNH